MRLQIPFLDEALAFSLALELHLIAAHLQMGAQLLFRELLVRLVDGVAAGADVDAAELWAFFLYVLYEVLVGVLCGIFLAEAFVAQWYLFDHLL